MRVFKPRFCVVLGRTVSWLALCIALAGCSSIFLYPDRVQHLPGRALGTPAEEVWIEARDGSRLHALYLPAPDTPRATVLFLHGNAENLSSHAHAVSWLPARGYGVLALDYRGYGYSQGDASLHAAHEDAESALDWLLAREPAVTGPLIVYGQSLGGSIAIRLVAGKAERGRLAGVIADSAFDSYRGIAREKLAALWLTWAMQAPLSWLIDDRYSAIEVVSRVSPLPLLLIHGDRDAIVGPEHAHRLYAAADMPKALWLIEGGAHIDAVRRTSVRDRLAAYLDALSAGARHRP